MPPLTFRDEQSADLTPEQVDANFRELEERIETIGDDLPDPVGLSGAINQITAYSIAFGLTDASFTDPVALPPPPTLTPRGTWQPLTSYFVNDVVKVRGVGFYLVMADHTSAASFPGAGVNYAFLFAEPSPANNLVISTSTLTLSAVAHANRCLLFTNVSGCDVTMDDDWSDSEEFAWIKVTAAPVTFSGISDFGVQAADGFDTAMSAQYGTGGGKFIESIGAMVLYGLLDPVSA